MKKALTISLAQTLFTIEDDAYAKLDAYIQSVRAHFAATQEQAEIIHDIESRIAEQFLETGKSIITVSEVDQVIATMGAVSDFGDNAEPVENTGKKKLYRNPDEAMIAGVCAGLAAYLDVDVVWVRLAAVLLTLANGIGILAYIILWIVIPEAKSASQKLQMSGSPVTVATLSENVKERFSDAAGKASPTFKKILAAPFVAIGIVLRAIVNKIFPVIRVLFGLFLATGSLIAIMAFTFLAPMIVSLSPGRYIDFPLQNVISAPILYGLVIGVYLVLTIPAIFIFLSGVGLVRKNNIIKASLGFGLLALWCLSLVFAGINGAKAAARYDDYRSNAPRFQVVENTMPITELVHTLEISKGQKITLIQGKESSVIVRARQKDIEFTDIKLEDGILAVSGINRPNSCILCDFKTGEVTITLPNLDSISVLNGSRVVAKEWKSDKRLTIVLDNGSRAEMNVVVPELYATLHYGSQFDLSGNAATSSLGAQYGSEIEAKKFVTQHADVLAVEGSRVYVQVIKTLMAHAAEGGRIDYIGTPQVTQETKQGGSIDGAETIEE